MCGRYVRKSPSASYAELFKVPMPELRASYNVAPTQTVLAILPRVAQAAWLDHSIEDPGALQELIRPYAPEAMALHPVSAVVGNVRNNAPELIEPAA